MGDFIGVELECRQQEDGKKNNGTGRVKWSEV